MLLQTVKKANIEQLHFKGDPMHRPVMSREIGVLVQGLVKLSEWLNHQIGLDQPAQECEMAETQIQVCSIIKLSDSRVTVLCELGLLSISLSVSAHVYRDNDSHAAVCSLDLSSLP